MRRAQADGRALLSCRRTAITPTARAKSAVAIHSRIRVARGAPTDREEIPGISCGML